MPTPRNNQPVHTPTPKGRGFAGMDPKRQREIAAEGGRAAHEQGTAHEFTSDEAREAGRKGHLAKKLAAHAQAPTKT
jgi:general stress protein YciG